MSQLSREDKNQIVLMRAINLKDTHPDFMDEEHFDALITYIDYCSEPILDLMRDQYDGAQVYLNQEKREREYEESLKKIRK